MKEEEKLNEPYSVNDYIKQQMKDNAAFNQGFNLGRQLAFSNQHIQIERIESTIKVNKFLSNIKRENIVDIKPMEHNTYLVIYTKEDEQ